MARRIMEARPWEALNSDGSLNLGSYEVLATLSTVELAHDLLLARSGPGSFTIDEVRRLARTLLAAADQVQANVRADGHSDRMDSSHTRARGAIRTALEHYPVPWGVPSEPPSPAEKAVWVDELVGWATLLVESAVDLLAFPAASIEKRVA